MQSNYSQEEVLQALQSILQDAKFAAAPQMSAFLKFVVTQTLEGKSGRIKAYTVAVDALGKPSTFDPQNDPSVRVLAKRLRDTLSAYYERTTGHTIKVQLFCGSYVPTFEKITDAQNQVESETIVDAQPVINSSNITPLNRPSDKKDIINSQLPNDDAGYAHKKFVKP